MKDVAIDDDRLAPAAAGRFAVSMALFTEGGGVFPASEVAAWLVEAGLEVVSTTALTAARAANVVVGRRPWRSLEFTSLYSGRVSEAPLNHDDPMLIDRPVILLGGGGHARVLIDALRLLSVQVLGVTDPRPDVLMMRVLGVPVLGPDQAILEHDPSEVLLVNGLGSVSDTSARKRLFTSFLSRGYAFAGLVHPRATMATTVLVSEGVQVMAGAVIQAGATLGDNVIINTRASVDHECQIGSHVHVAPGATLSGGVHVGEGAHIGTGAVLIEGIRIGARAIVGAGTVVLRDVPPDVTVVGNPARVLGGGGVEDTL